MAVLRQRIHCAQQFPQVRPDCIETVCDKIRAPDKIRLSQPAYDVRPGGFFVVKVLGDQRFIGAPDPVHIPQFCLHGAGGGFGGIGFRFLRGDLAFPQFCQRFPDFLHSARQFGHVFIEGQVFRRVCHRTVDSHYLAGFVQHPVVASAGLFPHQHAELLRADDLDVQQAVQVQAGNQVALCLQRHLFRNIQDHAASLRPAFRNRLQGLRPYASAPSLNYPQLIHLPEPFHNSIIGFSDNYTNSWR